MSYPVPANSPQFTVSGQTYCVAAFDWETPMGRNYCGGVFVKMNDGSWNAAILNNVTGIVIQYMNANDVITDMQAKGGRVKYLQWLLAKINEVLSKLFAGAPPAPVGEPTTDQQARDIISAWALGLSISGTPPQAK